jgi:phenylalanyl-tRNA synthetase alpha subunit
MCSLSPSTFPPEHPARDKQDTFFINQDPDILLRTHNLIRASQGDGTSKTTHPNHQPGPCFP